jgi:hypothetical protein
LAIIRNNVRVQVIGAEAPKVRVKVISMIRGKRFKIQSVKPVSREIVKKHRRFRNEDKIWFMC